MDVALYQINIIIIIMSTTMEATRNIGYNDTHYVNKVGVSAAVLEDGPDEVTILETHAQVEGRPVEL